MSRLGGIAAAAAALGVLLGGAGCRTSTFDDFLESTRATQLTQNVEGEVNTLVVRYQRARKKVDEYQVEVEKVRSQKEDLEARLRKSRAELATVKQALDKANADKANADKARTALASQLAEAQKAKADLGQKLGAVQKEVAALENDLKARQAEAERLHAGIADGVKEHELLAAEDERLGRSLARLRDRVNTLKGRLPGAEERIAELEHELRRLAGGDR